LTIELGSSQNNNSKNAIPAKRSYLVKHLKYAAACAVFTLGFAACPARAQQYGDDTPIGSDTPEQAMAWAQAFCGANSLEVTGYTSYQQCVDDVFIQTTPGPFSVGDSASYMIALPSGGKACRYYGSGGGGC
jgi:hypothetical protein